VAANRPTLDFSQNNIILSCRRLEFCLVRGNVRTWAWLMRVHSVMTVPVTAAGNARPELPSNRQNRSYVDGQALYCFLTGTHSLLPYILPSFHKRFFTPSSTAALPQSSPWLCIPGTIPALAFACSSFSTVNSPKINGTEVSSCTRISA
jgi:hypothetical protein